MYFYKIMNTVKTMSTYTSFLSSFVSGPEHQQITVNTRRCGDCAGQQKGHSHPVQKLKTHFSAAGSCFVVICSCWFVCIVFVSCECHVKLYSVQLQGTDLCEHLARRLQHGGDGMQLEFRYALQVGVGVCWVICPPNCFSSWFRIFSSVVHSNDANLCV